MMTEHKYQSKYKIISLTGLVFFNAVFLVFSHVRAASIDATCSTVEQCNDRAAIYRQIIDIKKKQTETLGIKISSMSSSIQDVRTQMQNTGNQIDGLNSQIGDLESQIEEKKVLIDSKKKVLIQVVQSYYQMTQTSPVAIYLSEDNIASFMINKDRMSQTGDKITQTIETINNLKEEIQTQSDELSKKKVDLVNAHQELQDKSNTLESAKKQQTILLAQTQGEQEQYAQLLKNVEEQKAELLNLNSFASSSFSLDGLSVDEYLKKHQPSSSLFASTSWYFSQKDSRWGGMTIGKTKTLMGDYGCAVTSLAMVFKKNGGSITPGTLAKEPIFSGDLIKWPENWDKPSLDLSSEGSYHKNISWSSIDKEIEGGNPVIVYIGRSGGGGHYVVIHHKASGGDYVVHDPYFGANIYLSSSRALIGAMGSSSSTYVDQMIIYN